MCLISVMFCQHTELNLVTLCPFHEHTGVLFTLFIGKLMLYYLFAYRLDKQLSIVGSPYWMAPECIAGNKYNEKVSILTIKLLILCNVFLHGGGSSRPSSLFLYLCLFVDVDMVTKNGCSYVLSCIKMVAKKCNVH